VREGGVVMKILRKETKVILVDEGIRERENWEREQWEGR